MKNYIMIMVTMLGLLAGCGIPDGYQVVNATRTGVYNQGTSDEYETYRLGNINFSDESYYEIRSHFPTNEPLNWRFEGSLISTNCGNIETTNISGYSESTPFFYVNETNGPLSMVNGELRIKPSVMDCLAGKPIQFEVLIVALDERHNLTGIMETINVVLMEN